MKKCLIIGATMLDISINIEKLPERGSDIYIEKENVGIGGCALNVANIIKHYSLPFTFFSPIGNGKYSKMIQSEFKKLSFDSDLKVIDEDNGYSLCLVEKDGERTFLTLPGVECKFRREWFENIAPEDYDCAYICGYEIEGEGGQYIIEFLEQNPDIKIYYAPSPRFKYIDKNKNERLFALSPVLHLNEKEAIEYTGEDELESAIKKLRAKTNNTVIVTLGERGALVLDELKLRYIDTKKAKVIDTIGAGDSHIAAIIAESCLGKSIDEAVEKANKLSAKLVSIEGSLLNKEDFETINF